MNASERTFRARAHVGHCMQEYVISRFKDFAAPFAEELRPGVSDQQLETAISRALYQLSAGAQDGAAPQLAVQFRHKCR
jgi:hypothetical protein